MRAPPPPITIAEYADRLRDSLSAGCPVTVNLRSDYWRSPRSPAPYVQLTRDLIGPLRSHVQGGAVYARAGSRFSELDYQLTERKGQGLSVRLDTRGVWDAQWLWGKGRNILLRVTAEALFAPSV